MRHRLRTMGGDMPGPLFVFAHPTRVATVTVHRGLLDPRADLSESRDEAEEDEEDQQEAGPVMRGSAGGILARLGRFARAVRRLRSWLDSTAEEVSWLRCLLC